MSHIYTQKKTENPPWMKMYFLLKMVNFQCHVCFQGGNVFYPWGMLFFPTPCTSRKFQLALKIIGRQFLQLRYHRTSTCLCEKNHFRCMLPVPDGFFSWAWYHGSFGGWSRGHPWDRWLPLYRKINGWTVAFSTNNSAMPGDFCFVTKLHPRSLKVTNNHIKGSLTPRKFNIAPQKLPSQ